MMLIPASTKIVSPVMPRAPSQHRNTAVSATSFDIALERRLFRTLFQHLSEIANPARSQRLDRSGRDCVDANVLHSEIVGEIANATFKRRLGHAHHVVMRDNTGGSVIGESNDTAALGHQRRSRPRDRNQRVTANVMGDAEAFAAGIGEAALEVLHGRVGDAVDDAVELAVTLFEGGEELLDLGVAGDVALEALGVGESVDHVFGFPAEALVLIGDGEFCAGFLQPLGDRPGDAALIRYAEDDGGLAFQAI